MALYRIRIKLCSPIVTPLKGDTIWGHIVWGIANHEGNEAVDKFLKKEQSDPPAMVVSSAFPAGMVCLPLPLPPEEKETSSERKRKKKIKYAYAGHFFDNMESAEKDEKDKDKKKEDEKKQSVLNSEPVMHNTIDRYTNTVLEEKSPFLIEEQWPKIKGGNAKAKYPYELFAEWDIYILSSFEHKRIKQLFEWAFENGYGADASTGKGKIDVISEAVPVKTKIKGNTYMALGPFVGSGNGITNLRADIFVRSGKLGGAFAAALTPYKKPVMLYDEGARFVSDKPIEYTGRLLEKMHHSEAYNICQSGFAPVIPIEERNYYDT